MRTPEEQLELSRYRVLAGFYALWGVLSIFVGKRYVTGAMWLLFGVILMIDIVLLKRSITKRRRLAIFIALAFLVLVGGQLLDAACVR